MLRIRTVYCLINMLSLPHFTQFYVKSMWPFKSAEPVRDGNATLCAPHGQSLLWGRVRGKVTHTWYRLAVDVWRLRAGRKV